MHFKMLGTLSCSSVNCHGGQSSSNARVRKSEEIHHWLANDPHAGARDLLDSLRYQTILNVVAAGQDRAQVQSRCNQCHDPAGASELGNYTLAQAISCETCHGNAEKWIGKHFERGVSRAQLTALGMTDTKNLADRAAMCAKCHVGSRDHDMNHDMIAAGHPPLRFEQAAYEDLIKYKHWNDGPARLEKQDYQVQLWAAGQTASAKARLDLLSARAEQLLPKSADEPKQAKQIWTEFAEFSCFSCHQKILPDPVAESTTKGSPVWSRWNLTFAGQLQANDSKLRASLLDLSSQRMSIDASKLIELSDSAHRGLSAAQTNEPLNRQKLLELVHASLQSPESDWETRSQQYLALSAIVRAQHDELAKAEFLGRIGPAHASERSAIQRLSEKLNQLGEALRFERPAQDVAPKGLILIDEPVRFRENRGQLGTDLLDLAKQLHDPKS